MSRLLFKTTPPPSNKGYHRGAKPAKSVFAIKECPLVLAPAVNGSIDEDAAILPHLIKVALVARAESKRYKALDEEALYSEMLERIKAVRSFLRRSINHLMVENSGREDAQSAVSRLQEMVETAMSKGELQSVEPHDEIIVVLAKLTVSVALASGVAGGEKRVEEMVRRGKDGLPPEKPYLREQWASPVEFVRETYGAFLSGDPDRNALYQDQLSWIHPGRKRIEEITGGQGQYGSDEWGEDVMQALRNHFAKHGGAKALARVVPPKKERNDKKLRKAGLSDAEIGDPRVRSAASLLPA